MFSLLKTVMPQSPKRRLRQHGLIGQIRRIVQTQILMERRTQLVRHCRRQVVSALVVSAVVLGVAGNAAAQTGGIKAHTPRVAGGFGYSACGVSGYACGYSPYGYASTFITPDPYGGYLRGTADVIHAQGSYLLNTQQAYLTREQVRAAQVENRRRLFDEWLYRQANTPSRNDERERTIREEARRSRNDPPLTEIWSAKALNDLLAVARKSRTGPDVAIDAEMLKKINLTEGDGSNFGLLKDDGKLSWPLALRGLDGSRALRDELQVALTKACNDAREGKNVDAATIQKIDGDMARLHQLLVKNVAAVPFPQYSEAKTYLKQLDDAVKLLKKGNAAKFLNGAMTPKVNTVGELVVFMTRKGLQFAPATTTDRGAYTTLHRALVAYDSGVSTLAAVSER